MTRPEREGGFGTPAYIAAATLALYMFAALANLIVVQYAAGVVRSALDEGTRAGSSGGVSACLQRTGEVLDGLLGGTYGDGVEVTCGEEGLWIRAVATATFESFVPLVPDLSYRFEAQAAREGT